jgi:hypothetical protein
LPVPPMMRMFFTPLRELQGAKTLHGRMSRIHL